jgi:predicted outer membrane protein
LKGAVALAAIAALAGCNMGDQGTTDSMALADTMGIDTQIATGATADGWTDAQIFGTLTALHGGRMAAAELANSRATDPEVKELARVIDREHTQMNQDLLALAERMGVEPVAPVDSGLIRDRNEDLKELLEKEAGREWDEEFVGELQDWQEDSRELLTRAIEATHSPELRQALMDMRSTVVQHITRANALKERLD